MQTLNPLQFAAEKAELESFCKVMSLEREEALPALRNLKVFLNTEGYLNFEKLDGGDNNAPILIFKLIDFNKIPIGVLKREPNSLRAEKRMTALDEMRSNGFEQLPYILKDIKGNYLVKLGEASFSCIEYLEPDSDQSNSFEQMFMLASSFHAYSKKSSLTEELRSKSLDKYSNENTSRLDRELLKWNPSIFETGAWQNCVKCASYFTSQEFLKIYNSLPSQLIHGDITPNNTITSKGKSFFIDFDSVKTDIRLLDFATFSGWSFLENYLTLTENDKLLSCIQTCYGNLEEMEKDNFHSIVLFRRCYVLEWSLSELKQALDCKDLKKEQQFGSILQGTIREINEICKRIPQIKKIID
jgi:thiamine kinase-like enzyme